ncbi:MAG: hypothetical protein AAF004_00635 [Pseudomonadota bacterium]
MTTPSTAPWLRLIRFAGDDRISFLQGQLTQDVALLNSSQPAMIAASCDPKGRVLAVLTLIHEADAIVVGIRDALADDWLNAILRYKMRAKVDTGEVTDLRMMRTTREQPSPAGAITHWNFGDCFEALVRTDDSVNGDDTDWREARLVAGVTDIASHATGSFTPHMLNLDAANAISFSKGCYTGQEVVARTQHLGAVKRRVRLLRSATRVDDDQPLDIVGDGKKIGRVVAAAGNVIAAVISTNDLNVAMTLDDGTVLTGLATD